MPVYVYADSAGHQREVAHRMLYTTGVVCACGLAMHRVPQAALINWNGNRAVGGTGPAVLDRLRNQDRYRDEYRRKKDAYEAEKRRIGRD